MAQIERTGEVRFHDSTLAVWEEPGRVSPGWETAFKREVFARIVQQLNRLGWTCVIPVEDESRYGRPFAEKRRYCVKGALEADLNILGRCIELKFFQNIANVSNRNGGKYDFDREERMPFVLRLEMERTRRRIRDYLCAVFAGYTFKGARPRRGIDGLTAVEWLEADTRSSSHYRAELGRRGGEDAKYNNQSADGTSVKHGARVWTTDHKGRVITGIAHYNINNMWWVVSGRYGLVNKGCFEIYAQQPDNLRRKRNSHERQRRLAGLLQEAVKAMRFERAALLRDLLYPCGVPGRALDGIEHNGFPEVTRA